MRVIREQYTDLAPGDWDAVRHYGYDSVQRKWDGDFVNIVCRGREASVISREGKLIDVLRLAQPSFPVTLLAERMTGKRPVGLAQSGLGGPGYVVFGAHPCGTEEHLSRAFYVAFALPVLKVVALSAASVGLAGQMWRGVVMQGHEGLIFRRSDRPGYCARMVNPDYRPFG